MLLDVKNLAVSYGAIRAVHDVSLSVDQGEIVSLIGANGAGKSSLLRCISGLVKSRAGNVYFNGKDVSSLSPQALVQSGIVHVPEGRGIFGNLTVLENLELATFTRRDKKKLRDDYDRAFALFPRLKERITQIAGTLSGGEQQMLAVARAMMTRGRLILLDEPSMGLAPVLVDEIFDTIRQINDEGTTILLVEQNASRALAMADRGYVLETGRVVLHGKARELQDDPRVKEAYLGG